MVRLADPAALRAHLARFDLARVPRAGLSPVDSRRLEHLLDRPYEDLDARDVVHALDLLSRGGLHAPLFGYFLPAALRAPPFADLAAGERFLEGLIAARADASVSDWDPEVEAVLERAVRARPYRGGDDPVDLWISNEAYHRVELEAARRGRASVRAASRANDLWTQAREGPPYVRLALLLLQRFPDRAVARLSAWEKTTSPADDNLVRAWVEILFHAHGEGWRPDLPDHPEIGAFLDAPQRAARAATLLAHGCHDLALGGAAVLRVLRPRAPVPPSVEARLAALDASPDDRFVLLPRVRALCLGT